MVPALWGPAYEMGDMYVYSDDVTYGCGRALSIVGEEEGGVPIQCPPCAGGFRYPIFVFGACPTHGDLAQRGLVTHITWWLTLFRLSVGLWGEVFLTPFTS